MRGATNGQEALKATFTKVVPSIDIGRRPLPREALSLLERLVVDSHLHLPDMVEITFFDEPGTVLSLTAAAVGDPITIRGQAAGSSAGPTVLFVGEVTSIEAAFGRTCHTVIRGYSADHRLQRVRKTRTFLNMTMSDIARKIAGQAGLPVGEVATTRTAHEHVGQLNQTDWEFLTAQARVIGYEVGVVDGKFFFRKAAGTTGGAAIELSYPDNLRTFCPRVSSGNLAPEVEVRVWDPNTARVDASVVPIRSTSVRLTSDTPAKLAKAFGANGQANQPNRPAPAKPATAPGTQNHGPEPSPSAYVVADRPLATGSAIGVAAAETAQGVAEHLGSTFAEAEGDAIGDPRLRAGAVIDVTGVSRHFSGKWVLTRARHIFDNSGYHTNFEVSGRQERSILGLASGGAGDSRTQQINGLVCGVVTDVNDPVRKRRVKVSLPWSSPGYVSDWSPVVQFGAGPRSGAMFLPEVGDEVLVGFEFGDPQRAYVLGGLINNRSTYLPGGEPVKATGKTAAIAWRGFTSPSGNMLAFHDEDSPKASEVVIGTQDRAISLTIDQKAGTVTVQAGPVTIQCGRSGIVDIQAGAGGTVNIDGGKQINLSAKQLNLAAQGGIKIESQGIVEIKGAQIKLN